MSNDFEGLDISMEEADGGSFIPEGEYPCIINVSEKTTSAAGNDYLKVELSVTGEKYSGWRVRKNFNLWYQHADAQKQTEIRGYANNDFARLLKACGMDTPPKSAVALQGKEVICKLIVKEAEEGSEYGPSNEVQAFSKAETMTPPKASNLPPSMSNDKEEKEDDKGAKPPSL